MTNNPELAGTNTNPLTLTVNTRFDPVWELLPDLFNWGTGKDEYIIIIFCKAYP